VWLEIEGGADAMTVLGNGKVAQFRPPDEESRKLVFWYSDFTVTVRDARSGGTARLKVMAHEARSSEADRVVASRQVRLAPFASPMPPEAQCEVIYLRPDAQVEGMAFLHALSDGADKIRFWGFPRDLAAQESV
jgi:hypothetical protein